MAKTPETRARQAQAMRDYWANLTVEQRQQIADKQSAKLKGQTRTTEQRLRNSEAQKGKRLSTEHRAKVAQGLKAAYAAGRKQPVRSTHRKGATVTAETRAKISASLKGCLPWNTGTTMGPRPAHVRKKISDGMQGRSYRVPEEQKTAWKKKISQTKTGSKHTDETKARMRLAQAQAWAEGRRSLSPKSGYGKGCFYASPFQGVVWLRSTSELQRARELDAANAIWFYEAIRYPLCFKGSRSSYTPDFWIVPNTRRDAVPSDAVTYLKNLHPSAYQVEDVKGYWKETHKTYEKVQAFQEQYPGIQFQIVVRQGEK